MAQIAEQEEKKKVPYKEGKQLNIRLSDEEYAELERRAKETGKSYKELICSEMELGRNIEVESDVSSPSSKRKKGDIVPFDPETQVEEFVRDAVKRNKSFFWGLDIAAVAKDVSSYVNWKELSEFGQAYLMMLAKHRYREEPRELEDALGKVGKTLEASPEELRAMLRRIKRTGESNYELIAE